MKTILLLGLMGFLMGWGYNPTLGVSGFAMRADPFQTSEAYTLADGNVVVKQLTNRQGKEMGKAIWINRTNQNVNAKYFAYRDKRGTGVYDRYETWRTDKEMVVACAGAYTTSGGIPDGLTVDAGEIVNRNLSTDKDGLVIIYATGGIVVSDIDEGDLVLGGIGKVDPRNSLDKIQILDWVEERRATMFQTHLLVYKDHMRIDSQGRTERANRRILALVKNPYGTLYHVLFDLTEPTYYLYDAARDVYNHLNSHSMEVVAVMNFDTGSYDILEIYNEEGEVLNDQYSNTHISRATNLLTYHYSK